MKNEKKITYDLSQSIIKQMALHPLKIVILDQLGTNPWINLIIKIDVKIIHQIIFYQEHIITARLRKYICILNRDTLPKDTLDQINLN